MAARNRVRILPAQLSSDNEFRTTISAIDETWNEVADTSKVKAIILSSPGNPSGEVFDADLIHSIVF